MEEMPHQEHDHAHTVAGEDRAEKACQFKGIQFRKWGSWVSEIRIPRSREKLWLGSYTTAEQAARAYDAAVYCLRGHNAIFNFPDSVPCIPSASSLSRHQIKLAAARYANGNAKKKKNGNAKKKKNENANAMKKEEAREDSASTSLSASVQETVSSIDGRHQQEVELAFWESLLAGSGDCFTQSLERLPSLDEVFPGPIPNWEEQHHEQHEEEDIHNFLQLTDLWNFRDI